MSCSTERKLFAEVSRQTLSSFLRGSRNIGFLKPRKRDLYIASKLPYGIVILRCVISHNSIDVIKYWQNYYVSFELSSVSCQYYSFFQIRIYTHRTTLVGRSFFLQASSSDLGDSQRETEIGLWDHQIRIRYKAWKFFTSYTTASFS